MEDIALELEHCKAEIAFMGDDFRAQDGSYLHTVRFPSLLEGQKRATIVYFHSYGAYTEKFCWISRKF